MKLKRRVLCSIVIFLLSVCGIPLCASHALAAESLNLWFQILDSGHDYIELQVIDAPASGTYQAHVTIDEKESVQDVKLTEESLQTVRLALAGPYAGGTKFSFYFEDETGNRSIVEDGVLKNCGIPDIDYFNAYPKRSIGRLSGYGSPELIKSITARIGSTEYPGTVDKTGGFAIDYPAQEEETEILIVVTCAYGCENNSTSPVYSENISPFTASAKRDRLTANHILEKGEVLFVKTGNAVYQSKPGTGSDYDGIVVPYPIQPEGTKVSYWVETENGSLSDIMEATVTNCDLGLEIDSIYPNYLTGFLTEISGDNGQYVIVQIGANQYRGNVTLQNGRRVFTVKYPNQKKGQSFTATVYDAHGCSSPPETFSLDSWNWLRPVINDYDILANHMNYTLDIDTRLCVQIGERLYTSGYAAESYYNVSVAYPTQKIGTKITYWLEDRTGRYSNKSVSEIQNPKITPGKFSLKSNRFTGTIVYGNHHMNEYSNATVAIKTVKLKVGKKTYKKNYKKPVKKFSFSYPRQKRGTKVKLTLTDANGFHYTKALTIKNEPPKLKLKEIKYGQNKLYGTTAPRNKVTLKIGNKTYRTKAAKNGKFTFQIPYQQAGKKLTVKTVNSFGFYNSKTISVKNVSANIWIDNLLYESTGRVNITATNVFCGERIDVFVSDGSGYSCPIGNDSRRLSTGIEIGGHSAGNTVRIVLYDKFGKIRNEASAWIYIGDSIYVGMPASQVELTTWGHAIRKNSYGNLLQWVFSDGSSLLYVYIENGVVVYLQRFS